MKHITLISLSIVAGTLGLAACDSNKSSTNSPQDRPPVVTGDTTATTHADSATANDRLHDNTIGDHSDTAAAGTRDATAAPTTGDSVAGTGDTRSASKVGDDAWITTKTKTALFAEDDLKQGDIQVETRGGKVTLTGKVPSKAQSMKAASVVRGVEGVTTVDNRLSINK